MGCRMSMRRALLTLVVSLLVAGGCGDGGDRAATSAATGAATTTAGHCIEQRMVSSFEITSLAEMVEMSDVVAEIEITGRLDAVTGAEAGDTVSRAIATTSSTDRDQDVILVGESSHVTLHPGVRAIAGLRSSRGDLYELSGGLLIETGGLLEALPPATCPGAPPSALARPTTSRSARANESWGWSSAIGASCCRRTK